MTHRLGSRILAGLTLLLLVGCGGAAAPAAAPLQQWMAISPMYIAHRGGDASWTEGTADAYAHAAAWNPDLALEVPVQLTSDGVWVVSEDPTTQRVFGSNYKISRTPWATLAALRTVNGHHPMARLVNDILAVYPQNRIIFIDDKAGIAVDGFLALLDAHGGPTRFVVKTYWQSVQLPAQARDLGYLTWGYYYAKDMRHFAATQSRFNLLGLNYNAPAADFATMRATGKPVIAHIIDSAQAAATALHKGATGLMVSAVQQVVPHTAGRP